MAGQGRQWLFMCHVKQTFLQQPRFQQFKGALQGAGAGLFHVFNDQLVVTTALINAQPRLDDDLHAVFGFETQQHVAVAEHRAADLGLFILEGQVPVAGGGY